MSVAISPIRTFNILSTVDEDISVTFKFIPAEDWEIKKNDGGNNVMTRMLRQSIESWEGFYMADEDGNLTDQPLEVTEESQQAVLGWIQLNDKPMYKDVLEKLGGITPKKLKSGAKPQDSGNGIPPTAEDANSQENA